MVVKIPASFRDSNQQPVDMENVHVGIQFFDKDHRKLEIILQDTVMSSVTRGTYLYEYKIPPHAQPGNYVVHIKAKHAGSISNVYDASDTFEVVDSIETVASMESDAPPAPVPTVQEEVKKPDFDISTFKIDQVKRNNQFTKLDVEDSVVDPYNNPVKGVHVNVFLKQGFMPKSPNNVKVASTITDENGTWRISLSPGDYVFSYKGIAFREIREFRKV